MAAMLDDVTTPSSATTHDIFIILYNTLESVYQSTNLLEIMWTHKLKGSPLKKVCLYVRGLKCPTMEQ